MKEDLPPLSSDPHFSATEETLSIDWLGTGHPVELKRYRSPLSVFPYIYSGQLPGYVKPLYLCLVSPQDWTPEKSPLTGGTWGATLHEEPPFDSDQREKKGLEYPLSDNSQATLPSTAIIQAFQARHKRMGFPEDRVPLTDLLGNPPRFKE